MANCELSNLGVEFGDKIKENEQLAWGLGVGEEVNRALPLGGRVGRLRQGAESGFPHHPFLLLRNTER